MQPGPAHHRPVASDLETIRKGIGFLVSRQGPDGSWRGDYSGPMFLLPMYVMASYVTRQEIPEAARQGMARHLCRVQNPDGAVGLHAEDGGSMFTTSLCYVALRLLGRGPDDPALGRMRRWIQEHGTPLGAASWGKLMLALLNLYPMEDLDPVPPELWLLPSSLPVHPGKLWCHARQVYLSMAWLYGTRSRAPADPLIDALRMELYGKPYDTIDFSAHRDAVSPSDDRCPTGRLSRAASRVMRLHERLVPDRVRDKALRTLLEHIRFEDQSTGHIDIGPVNAVLNSIVHYFNDPEGLEFRASRKALGSYLRREGDELRMNGYVSTALWDTAFAVQAIQASPFAADHEPALAKAGGFIRESQIRDDPPGFERFHRHAWRGGWPFGDRAAGWPVSDCTAQGFRSLVALEGLLDRWPDEDLLKDAIRLVLSYQNPDGGFSSYEPKRGRDWLELLNPSQVFGSIMVEHSYVECTAACLEALALASRRFPGWKAPEIARAVERGRRFILGMQHKNGGWHGSWGVSFTYAAWFGVSGLLAAGQSPASREIRKACGFLMSRQEPDGGWGESAESCVQGKYVRSGRSHTVQTAWALLALVAAGLGDVESARRAAALLAARQLPDGDWPDEPMVGVFNRTVLIHYENYRRYFPIRALAEFRKARTG